ncbi:hypothetical protein B0F90DRAFT_385330 [Multifurca ochricompacta]|uniref:Uncharacterized protein n=1 Tax=Multifurca ochricompacta TaxID=376703 RepID=A0AAD4LXC5_9AGAM|nr:hypothetical protein B0F90DRAFT_385330 [Multifurca ochricompacta]
MTEMLGKIMAEVLCILALATKEMKQRRIKAFVKRLAGRTDVEDALQRLDKLTHEEMRMTVAKNLEVTYDVDGNVKAIKTVANSVDENVKVIKEATQSVGDNVNVVKEVAYSIKACANRNDVPQSSRDDLRRWLSPPDPSTNHNVARGSHHDGTASWFTRGDTYKQWKMTGSLFGIRKEHSLLDDYPRNRAITRDRRSFDGILLFRL